MADSRNVPARYEAPRASEGDYVVYEDGPEPSDEVDLRQLLATLRRRKGTILAFVLPCLLGAGFLVYREQPVYTATALIRLEDTERAIAGGLDMALSGRGGGTVVDAQLQILTSAQVLGEAVDRVGLRLVPLTPDFRPSTLVAVWVNPQMTADTLHLEFRAGGIRARMAGEVVEAGYAELVPLPGVRFAVQAHPGVDEARLEVRNRQRAIDALAGGLRTPRRGTTDVVEVEYSATDPELAMQVVNAVVVAFRERNVRAARQSAERRRVFIEEQLHQADSLLADAQRTLSDFRSRERAFSSQERFIAQQTGLMNLETRRGELATSRSMYRTILDGLRGAGVGQVATRLESLVASPEIAANPVVASLFQELLRFESERDALVSGPTAFSRTHPDVMRLEAQILSTTARLEDAARSHVEQLDAQVEALDDLRARYSAEIATLPEVEAEEARLIQQLRFVEGTVNQLREEYQRARISEAVEAGQIDVIDFASVPLDPQASRRALKLMLGLVLGLMAGSGTALFAESLNTKIRHREEMETALRIPSLGILPRIQPDGAAFGTAGGRRARRFLGAGNGKGKGRVDSTADLVTLTDARSPHAEAFRTIRTNLLFSDAVKGLQTLVITSAAPEEGKTTTAANLAVAYAQQGMKVLLLDCDLRKARLHQVFGFERQPGFSDLILGQANWEKVIHDMPVDGLQVLTAGPLPPNPSELLGGERMRAAMELFRKGFDMVIVDSPPMVAGPDAAILGSFCDGVLLVVRAGRTEREAGQQAVRQLRAVGARVLGAVLNDPDGNLPQYSSYDAYRYRYYAEEVEA